MLGFAILGLLGVALIVGLVDDDDEETVEEASTREQGSSGADLIEVGDGNDTVFAAGGDDAVIAGAGNDRVFGDDGDDLIAGGPGNDFLRGGADDDLIQGGTGEDTLFGDVGNDFVDGTDIIDVEGLFAATQDAILNGTTLTDAQIDAFANTANETGEADTLSGGVGDDTILAGSNDLVTTGPGRDEVNLGDWVIPGEPVEITDFALGKDSLVFSYEGATPPNVFLAEDDDGLVTVEVDGGTVAILTGLDFVDVQNAGLTVLVVPFS